MLALQLDAILIIALFVATAGIAVSRFFSNLDRPYLFTFSGSRIRLRVLKTVISVSAGLSSVGVCIILLVALPRDPALAIFFAFEAIMLDVCTQRIEYLQVETTPVRSTARATHHGTVTGAL